MGVGWGLLHDRTGSYNVVCIWLLPWRIGGAPSTCQCAKRPFAQPPPTERERDGPRTARILWTLAAVGACAAVFALYTRGRFPRGELANQLWSCF